MIYYTTTKTDCLISLMQCISNGNAKFWFSDKVSFSKMTTVLKKLILEYELDLPEAIRKKRSDYGEPVWSLVVNYDPAQSDLFQFWLFTTGFREARRSKLTLKEILARNSSMVQKQKLNSILTVKPEKLLRYGNYVLGQYIEFSDLKSHFSKAYYHPEKFGVVFNTKAKNTKVIDSNKNLNHRIFKPLDDFELNRFSSIRKNFGFVFLDDELNRWNQITVSKFLKDQFHVNFTDEVEYNDRLKKMSELLRGIRKKHLELFQRYSRKKVRFTWYLSNDFMHSANLELQKKINFVGTDKADRLKEACFRLNANANFHGTRHQIGALQAKIRFLLNEKDPYGRHINKKYFPEKLHFVRFSRKKSMNINDFLNQCLDANTLYLNKLQNRRRKKLGIIINSRTLSK